MRDAILQKLGYRVLHIQAAEFNAASDKTSFIKEKISSFIKSIPQ